MSVLNSSENSVTDSADQSTAERLIASAGKIFAEKGLDATVREICREAGCSVAAINYHFGDKHNLYVRCVQTACEDKRKLFPVPELDPGVPADNVLREFLRVICRRLVAKAELSWQSTLMLREVLNPSPGVAQTLSVSFHQDFRRLDELLRKLLGSADSEPRRQSLAVQILSRTMFLRTGTNLCQMLDLQVPLTDDPDAYAAELSQSILDQIRCMASVGSGADHAPAIKRKPISH